MTTANSQQADHWNNADEVGHWISEQARHDRMLAPFADMIFEAAHLTPGERVLDIGCGCGTTTLAAARLVAPGLTTGLDLSRAMLEQGRTEAAAQGVTNVAFQDADAQVYTFDPNVYDAIVSRFGIMFFDDPVTAFSNVRGAARQGGRLTVVCWQPLIENQWLIVPGAAVLKHVPMPEAAAPDSPGMFAFADPERLRTVLGAAGWRDVTITSRHTPMLVGGGGTIDDAVQFLRYGPIGRTMLANADADTVTRAVEDVRAALADRLTSDGVVLDAAVWLVTARA
jgi:SAM-dependent methyltransferase